MTVSVCAEAASAAMWRPRFWYRSELKGLGNRAQSLSGDPTRNTLIYTPKFFSRLPLIMHSSPEYPYSHSVPIPISPACAQKGRLVWEIIHRSSGWIAFVLGFVTIGLGLYLPVTYASNTLKYLYFCWLGFLGLLAIMLFSWSMCAARREKSPDMQNTSGYQDTQSTTGGMSPRQDVKAMPSQNQKDMEAGTNQALTGGDTNSDDRSRNEVLNV